MRHFAATWRTWAGVWAKPAEAIFLSLAFLSLGLGLLWILNYLTGWNLKVVDTHAAFFQAWIYILQTFALIATLAYIGFQARAVDSSARVNAVQLMLTAHREVFGRLLDQPELAELFSRSDIRALTFKQTTFLSMVMNHGFNAFSLKNEEYIDDEWWVAILQDMRSALDRPAVRGWWIGVRDLYPIRYRAFVDQTILLGPKEN